MNYIPEEKERPRRRLGFKRAKKSGAGGYKNRVLWISAWAGVILGIVLFLSWALPFFGDVLAEWYVADDCDNSPWISICRYPNGIPSGEEYISPDEWLRRCSENPETEGCKPFVKFCADLPEKAALVNIWRRYCH